MIEKYSKEELKKNYLTKKQASELLQTSTRTINRYIATNKIKTMLLNNIRYIDKKSLEKYIEEYSKR